MCKSSEFLPPPFDWKTFVLGSPYLNAGHSAGNVEILSVPAPRLHQSDTIAAANILGSVLAGSNVHGCYYVGRVSVEPT